KNRLPNSLQDLLALLELLQQAPGLVYLLLEVTLSRQVGPRVLIHVQAALADAEAGQAVVGQSQVVFASVGPVHTVHKHIDGPNRHSESLFQQQGVLTKFLLDALS